MRVLFYPVKAYSTKVAEQIETDLELKKNKINL